MYCNAYCIVQVAILFRWRYCSGGDIIQLAILLWWRYCSIGDIVQVAILFRWRYCYGGDIVQLAILLWWRCCSSGDIVQVAILFKWRYLSYFEFYHTQQRFLSTVRPYFPLGALMAGAWWPRSPEDQSHHRNNYVGIVSLSINTWLESKIGYHSAIWHLNEK